MKKISAFLIKSRYILLFIFGALTVLCAILFPKININKDMTKYLPDSSQMSQGIKVMKEEFHSSETSANNIYLMIDDLTASEKEEAKAKLSSIKNIVLVNYEVSSDYYNKDNHSYFVITAASSDSINEIEDEINTVFSQKTISYYDTVNNTYLPTIIVVVALIVVLVIMLVMCGSYIEPFLFLLTIGVAVIINMGSNVLLPSVSETTNSISAVLQVVLSMDYSIILSNRYRQACKKNDNHVAAMETALSESITSVCSSALTTIVGLLSLLFMSFKIGGDLGIVLAKGVFLSMLCVFTVLPAIMLIFDKVINKTSKKPLTIPMKKLANFSYNKKYVLSGIFFAIFIAAFIGKNYAGIEYDVPVENDIVKIFPSESQIVVLYNNKDEALINNFIKDFEKEEGIVSINAYANTLGLGYTADGLSAMMSQMSMDESVIHLLLYEKNADRSGETLSVSELLDYITKDLANNDLFKEYLDENTLSQISRYSALLDTVISMSDPYAIEMIADSLSVDVEVIKTLFYAIVDKKQFGVNEMYLLIQQLTDEIKPEYINLLYEFYFANKNFDDSWTITIDEVFDILLNSDSFSTIIPSDKKLMLSLAASTITDNKKNLVADNYSRIIITNNLINGSDEQMSLVNKIMDYCDKTFANSHYYIGNSIMANEMQNTFGGELNKITLITALAILIVVMISFKSLIIPVILVLIIQGSVYVTMSVMGIVHYNMMYLALLIMQCILMGATIDYAIVFTNFYREKRETSDVKTALERTYQGSIRTILTSGLIMAFATAIIGLTFHDLTTGPICRIISAGVISALILIIIFLPSILAVFDRFIVKPKKQ